jgi:hypothetical protein
MYAALSTLLILLSAGPAWAGSVDEFRDSIERDRSGDSRSGRGGGGESSANEDDDYGEYDGDEDDDEAS